jgi:hypothetical protein
MLAQSDANLIWCEGGSAAVGRTHQRPGDDTTDFGEWRAMGFDGRSVVADPLFVRPSSDDYRLEAGSPAWALGFRAIPADRIGLFASPDRATWPVQGASASRETPLTRPATGWPGRLRGWARDRAVAAMPWLPEWRGRLQATLGPALPLVLALATYVLWRRRRRARRAAAGSGSRDRS